MLTFDSATSGPVVVFQPVDKALSALPVAVGEGKVYVTLDVSRQALQALRNLTCLEPVRSDGAVDPLEHHCAILSFTPMVIRAPQRRCPGRWIQAEPVALMSGRSLGAEQHLEAPVHIHSQLIDIQCADRRTRLIRHS